MINSSAHIPVNCYHCGDTCDSTPVIVDDKNFCCQGCKQVYLLLNENNLCSYYELDKTPGLKAKGRFVSDRFAYLDDDATIQKLAQFKSDRQVNISFSIPQMHCSSCIYLLENLHRIEPGVKQSRTNFQQKEVFVMYDPQQVSLRKVVELLAFIGYEPYISLNDTGSKKKNNFSKSQLYRIGVAGFCFANIMMLSFPEYFSSGNIEEAGLKATFTWINLLLSLPVLFFSASAIFSSAWKGLRQKFLNIDAPIALAIIVTFARSYYEIISGTGAGYLDSGTGIVFFMLVGRWFQNKTYDFFIDRDYRSYFPLGVSVIDKGVEKNIPVTQLKVSDRIIIRNEEMIPADAVLMKGVASIDYSFVSGENTPVEKQKGELIYAGGKQTGSAIELEIIKEASQSYITRLWNNEIFNSKKNEEKSFIHPWSRYFTMALFSIAIGALIYWWVFDTSKILPAVTAVLIVACPCSLLLSETFTYGNMLRIFGRNKLYMKNAGVIESLAKVNSIVFDKTGTITQNHSSVLSYDGTPLTDTELVAVRNITRQSSHPLSKIIASELKTIADKDLVIDHFKEYTGKGLEATVNDMEVKIGSAGFMNQFNEGFASSPDTGSHVHLMMNNVHMGRFTVRTQYRDGISNMIKQLRREDLDLFVLSGDNNVEKPNLEKIFGKRTRLHFNQSPQEKLDFVKELQQGEKNVLMLGDGLNDAGALMQSNVGIAVSENSAQFSPASDAILDGSKVGLLDKFIAYAKAGKKIVLASFILSILYNIVGLSFAVQGTLSPIVAAILMPASSISIVLFVTILSSYVARKKGLGIST